MISDYESATKDHINMNKHRNVTTLFAVQATENRVFPDQYITSKCNEHKA